MDTRRNLEALHRKGRTFEFMERADRTTARRQAVSRLAFYAGAHGRAPVVRVAPSWSARLWARFCDWFWHRLVPECCKVLLAMVVLGLVGAAVTRVLLSNLAAATQVMP